MPYVGRDLQRGNYLKLDDLESQFNGSKTTFNLESGGSAFYPGSAYSILVSLGGIVQEPESAYTINQNTITFASAPVTNDEFFCIALGVALGVGVPGHGTVNGSQLASPFEYDNYFYLDSANNRVGIHSSTPTVALDVKGDIKLSGSLIGAGGGIGGGIGTFTGLDVNGNADISGNLNIGGVLTYEDVTNVDAIGIITAREGIHLGAGATVGHLSTVGVSTIASLTVKGALDVDGQTDLDVLNVSDVATFSSDVSIADKIIHTGDTNNALRFPAADTFTIETAGTERFRVGSNGYIGVGDFSSKSRTDPLNVDSGIGTCNIGGNYIHLKRYSGGNTQYINAPQNNANLHISADDFIAFGVDHSSSMYSMGKELLRIKANGQIVLGSDGTNSELTFSQDGTSGTVLNSTTTGFGGYNTLTLNSASLVHKYGSNVRFTIDSSGNLNIQNTAFLSGHTGYRHINVGNNLVLQGTTDTGGGFTGLSNNAYINASGNWVRIRNDHASDIGMDNGNFYFRQTGAGTGNITWSSPFTITAAGNIGINQSAPASRLHISESGSSTIQMQFTNATTGHSGGTDGMTFGYSSSSSAGFINVCESAAFTIKTGGTAAGNERLRIASGGQLQIGNTETPSNYNGSADDIMLGSHSGSHGMTILSATNGGGYIMFSDNNGGGSNAYRGQIEYQHNGDYMRFITATLERLRIDSSGNVNFGAEKAVALPSGTGIQVYNSSAPRIKLVNDTTGNASGDGFQLYLSGSGVILDQKEDAEMRFYTDATEKLRISSDGDVFIGRTSQLSNAKVTVQCDTGEAALAVQCNASNGTTNLLQAYNSGGANIVNISNNNDNTPDLLFNLYDGSNTVERLRITHDGQLQTRQDYPLVRPSLDFNFALTKKLDPRIKYYRTGPATYIDENGIVRYASANTPRFDHDATTRECRGFLMEDGRTSLSNQSSGNEATSDFRQTSNGAIITGPDGIENSARKYTVDSNGSTGGSTTIWVNNQAIGIANPTSVSCYVKIITGSTMAFVFMENNNSLNSDKITISGGPITNGDYATASHSVQGSSEGTMSYDLLPNGWVRLKWENVSHNANSNSYLQLYVYDHADAASNTISYAVWGFQVETGTTCTSTIPKPYTAPVARGRDYAFIDGQDFTDLYNVPEGTFVLRASVDDLTVANQGLWGVEDTSNGSGSFNMVGYRVGGGASGHVGYWYNNNGSTSAFHTMNAGVTKGVPFTGAFAYKKNDMAASTNGMTVVADGTAAITNDGLYDRFALGGYHYDSPMSAHIQRAMYYPKWIPHSQVKTITS